MRSLRAALSIGAAAAAAGVNVETIRFYQRKGLIVEPPRPYGRVRRYGEEVVSRVRFIKAAQGLGFSLDEIAELLRLDNGARCDEVRRLAIQKLEVVREKLRTLRRMEASLVQGIAACGARPSRVSCPLITALRRGEAGLTGAADGAR